MTEKRRKRAILKAFANLVIHRCKTVNIEDYMINVEEKQDDRKTKIQGRG